MVRLGSRVTAIHETRRSQRSPGSAVSTSSGPSRCHPWLEELEQRLNPGSLPPAPGFVVAPLDISVGPLTITGSRMRVTPVVRRLPS